MPSHIMTCLRNKPYPNLVLSVSIFVVWLHGGTAQSNVHSYAGRVLNDILKSEKYDQQVRPAGTNESTVPLFFTACVKCPLVITTDLLIQSIRDIDDHEMWRDDRLRYKDLKARLKYVIVNQPSNLWMPDSFFLSELSGNFHNIMKPNVLVRIYPDGTVLYSTRLSLRLSCPMDLKIVPFDRQTCSMKIESYGFSTDDIVFQWRENDPVQVVRGLHLTKFSLSKFATDYCTVRTTTGGYSCLQLDLQFERERSEYMVNVYIPCIMLFLLSWVTLWVSHKNTMLRILMPLIVLLAAASFVSKLNQEQLTRSSYTKAVDTWTGVCVTFLFVMVLYVATVDYTIRALNSGGHAASAPSTKDDETKREDHTAKTIVGAPVPSTFTQILKAWIQRSKSLPEKMDVSARFAFAVCFLLFVIIYFSIHAGSSADD